MYFTMDPRMRHIHDALVAAVTNPENLRRVIFREHAIVDEAEVAYNAGNYRHYQRWMQRLSDGNFQIRRSERLRRRRVR